MKSTCRRCHGQGKIISTPCRQCSGTGSTVRAQTVHVQVPAGVADGQTLRIPVGHSEAFVVLKVRVDLCVGDVQRIFTCACELEMKI